MNHFKCISYIFACAFNRKAILTIEIEIAGHIEKDEIYTFDDIEKRMQMF